MKPHAKQTPGNLPIANSERNSFKNPGCSKGVLVHQPLDFSGRMIQIPQKPEVVLGHFCWGGFPFPRRESQGCGLHHVMDLVSFHPNDSSRKRMSTFFKVSTHLKNMRSSNWIISPGIGMKKKYLSCHHLVFDGSNKHSGRIFCMCQRLPIQKFFSSVSKKFVSWSPYIYASYG